MAIDFGVLILIFYFWILFCVLYFGMKMSRRRNSCGPSSVETAVPTPGVVTSVSCSGPGLGPLLPGTHLIDMLPLVISSPEVTAFIASPEISGPRVRITCTRMMYEVGWREREVFSRYKSVCYRRLRMFRGRTNSQIFLWSFTVLRVLPLYKSNHR